MQYYTAYGLTIAADLPLPELTPVPAEGAADVVVSRGNLDPPPVDALDKPRYIVHRDDGTYFYWSALGGLLVSDGNRIEYDLNDQGDLETLRLPLLGMGLGTLLHQRGLLTLHASAVSIAEGAVSFIGWKGAGKSTTAAGLHERGHQVVTDDVLPVHATREGSVVHPAFPQLKLDPSAVRALGHDPQDQRPTAPGQPKRVFRPKGVDVEAVLPLHGIYLLDYGPEIRCTRLDNLTAFPTVLSQTYATRFVGTRGTGAAHFQQLSLLLQTVPVFHLERPRRLEELNDLAAYIEQHVCEHVARGVSDWLTDE